MLGGGVAVLFLGLFGHVSNGLAVVGGGAILTFLGVAVLGPIIAGPLSRVIGAAGRRGEGRHGHAWPARTPCATRAAPRRPPPRS